MSTRPEPDSRVEAIELQAPTRDLAAEGEAALALVLRGGVAVATVMLVAALVTSIYLGVPLVGHTFPVNELFTGQHDAVQILAQLGLLALCVTPLLRVAFSVLVFGRAGEPRQAWIAAGVLCLLILGMFLGAVE